MSSNKEKAPADIRKCPDEATLAGYLDYRLPSKDWQDVRGHCYFCKKCQKIVRIFVKAIELRRQRVGLLENNRDNELLETWRLGLLKSPPGDPKWAKVAEEVQKRAEPY